MRIRPFRGNWIFLLIGIALFMTGCQTLPPSYDRGLYHTVKKGQTLYAIAKAYGMGVEALARINRIRDVNHLHVGQRLWIPRAVLAAEVPVTFRPHTHAKKTLPKIARKPAPPSPRPQSSSRKSVQAASSSQKFIWPVKGGILTSRFGYRNGRNHEGIDIGAKEGTPIRAAAEGTVMFSGKGPTGYGLMVIIKHPGNLMSVYSHNSKNYVYEKMRVQQGQMVAAVGSTGRSTGPHLHFEMRNDTHPIDPLLYLPKL